MKQVTIYIETSLQGPSVKDGKYAAIIEFINQAGEPVTREVAGAEKDTTYHRSTLLAAVKALEKLNQPCEVIIKTNCIFIKNIVERGSPEEWKRSEWKKPSGEEVKNKELWQEFLEQMDKHKIGFQFSKHHAYKDFLQGRLRKELAYEQDDHI